MKAFLIASAALLAGATTVPALAAPRTAEPPAATAPATDMPSHVAKPTRYCVVETLVGSRIPTKVCKTRDEWLDQGVDITKPRD